MKRKTWNQIVGLFILIGLLTACKKKDASDGWDDTLTSGIIPIACDESFRSLMESEIQVFEARNPGAIILPIYTNEMEAIRLLVADSVRLAVTTRDLRSGERAEMKKNKIMNVRANLIAFDGVALITNRQNTDSLLSILTLKKILTGEITEWSQINVHSLLGTIRVLTENQESGILRYTLDSIVGNAKLTSNIYALPNDTAIVNKVLEMPNTLGLISISALNGMDSKTLENIRLVRISPDEPATLAYGYLPYAGDIRQENYPFWRPVYVLLSDPRSGLSSGLSIFLAQEIGQKIILRAGLLPVTDPQNRSVAIQDAYPQ
ncbi:MAG: substrate-binding domain-containing protein [Dysgonamonadaceae bacterium]|jgi:phosphate transport system substrate-binding protein|nr:substrate-binding domain-containing protein [Dysgonamonadaceae bacterium]